MPLIKSREFLSIILIPSCKHLYYYFVTVNNFTYITKFIKINFKRLAEKNLKEIKTNLVKR